MELFSLVGLVAALAAALGGVIVFLQARRRKRRPSTAAAAVRRRNALRDELRELIPESAELDRVVQAEARRLRVSDSSVEAYESAVARIKAKPPAPPPGAQRTS